MKLKWKQSQPNVRHMAPKQSITLGSNLDPKALGNSQHLGEDCKWSLSISY